MSKKSDENRKALLDHRNPTNPAEASVLIVNLLKAILRELSK